MATGDTDPRVLRVVAASPRLLEFALVYGQWTRHWEECDQGCHTNGHGVGNDWERCASGDALLREVNSLHTIAEQAVLPEPLDYYANEEDPAALVGAR